MCRFVLYRGSEITLSSLITEPSNSLIHQSFHSHERAEPLNGDGFGVAWYAPEMSDEPALFSAVTPAWNNANLRHLARVTKSPCVLAHIRAATPGLPVTLLNCHPFLWGPFAFMHNGHVGGFPRLRRRLLERLSDEAFSLIGGSTDSEHIFALFVDHYRQLDHQDPAEKLARALVRAIGEVEELRRVAHVEQESLLNLAVSDGRVAVATRFSSAGPGTAPSLYVHSGSRFVSLEDSFCMLDPDSGHGAVIIASERLSGDPRWQRVKTNHLVVVREDLTVELRALT